MHRVRYADEPGLSLDPELVHTGSNSGYQAINLAVLLGAARILLLGYDMRITGERTHWHGDHPVGMTNPLQGTLAGWVPAFAGAAADLERLGVVCINCSRETALTCFPRARVEDVL